MGEAFRLAREEMAAENQSIGDLRDKLLDALKDMEEVEVNGDLAARPELVNSDPFGDGWMIRVRIADDTQVAGLLDAGAYERLTAEA